MKLISCYISLSKMLRRLLNSVVLHYGLTSVRQTRHETLEQDISIDNCFLNRVMSWLTAEPDRWDCSFEYTCIPDNRSQHLLPQISMLSI